MTTARQGGGPGSDNRASVWLLLAVVHAAGGGCVCLVTYACWCLATCGLMGLVAMNQLSEAAAMGVNVCKMTCLPGWLPPTHTK